ncbi:MAG TPA: VOC family protein [Candidatus Sulfotelmatobacter sp.]|jgi:catechol 2,3-dioxygenase-like lactoylglutathione lyase family enzyme|nr:VOC family protein [Candidatus Sulfotelmatobacter sp.]
MQRSRYVVALIFCLAACLGASNFHAYAQSTSTQRPRILGIDHVSFYTTDPDGVNKLYSGILGLTSTSPVERGGLVRFMVGKQWVGYSNAPDPNAIDRMDHVAFATNNIVALREYLAANGVKVPAIENHGDHSMSVTVLDPEGHRIEFVERGKSQASPSPDSAVSRHMIHVGFLVKDRDAEDHFYRDLLGFHLYWHGGMQPDKTDWVAMQVPDGTDWLEYMLNHPEHPDLKLMGVLNHISLGVADMKKAQAILESHGWKPHGSEKAQMGKDGKWQLNVFDPDLTRIELMEFKPVEKPCCADFTGPHPSE